MKNYISIGGKKIEISEETALNLKKELTSKTKETPSDEVAIGEYKFIHKIDWGKKDEVPIKDNPEKKIFVNQKFADGSVFGNDCVFIRCKFGSYCEFGSVCEFGSYCEFGSHCKFGYCCRKQTPYWDDDGRHDN